MIIWRPKALRWGALFVSSRADGAVSSARSRRLTGFCALGVIPQGDFQGVALARIQDRTPAATDQDGLESVPRLRPGEMIMRVRNADGDNFVREREEPPAAHCAPRWALALHPLLESWVQGLAPFALR